MKARKGSIVVRVHTGEPMKETKGTRIAREIRAKCNGLNKNQRDYYHKIGIMLIYGNKQK